MGLTGLKSGCPGPVLLLEAVGGNPFPSTVSRSQSDSLTHSLSLHSQSQQDNIYKSLFLPVFLARARVRAHTRTPLPFLPDPFPDKGPVIALTLLGDAGYHPHHRLTDLHGNILTEPTDQDTDIFGGTTDLPTMLSF